MVGTIGERVKACQGPAESEPIKSHDNSSLHLLRFTVTFHGLRERAEGLFSHPVGGGVMLVRVPLPMVASARLLTGLSKKE